MNNSNRWILYLTIENDNLSYNILDVKPEDTPIEYERPENPFNESKFSYSFPTREIALEVLQEAMCFAKSPIEKVLYIDTYDKFSKSEYYTKLKVIQN